MDSALDFSMKKRPVENKKSQIRECHSHPHSLQRLVHPNSWKAAITPPSPCMPHSPIQNSKTLFDMLRYGSNALDVVTMSTTLNGMMPSYSPMSSLSISPRVLNASSTIMGGPSLMKAAAESTVFPTTSLAMSTFHHRRRSNSDNTNSGDSETETSCKKPKCIPDDKKDIAYWERRRKNNEAAKRSRDTRRAKEEEIALRAAYLEQENLKLKAQVNVLKTETARLHCMLFSHVQTVVSC
ncbi:unnamed protein product [Soboliphyme baturini]|uniref:BZIP domain-containing protein n=1 Tax=Soboliphyme baturini TaxID=241478 RepID=A0A183INY9_9BILA|nr:unnamed protein product [Soboliphyme baturini]